MASPVGKLLHRCSNGYNVTIIKLCLQIFLYYSIWATIEIFFVKGCKSEASDMRGGDAAVRRSTIVYYYYLVKTEQFIESESIRLVRFWSTGYGQITTVVII